jgi:integrase
MSPKKKPKKPYASFPLYAHSAGQWAKKVRGKTYYFGAWSDPNGALERYLAEKDYLYNGLAPPEPKETVGQVIASFLRHKQAQRDTDDIAEVTFNEYETTCNVISNHLGKHFPVDSIDFADLRVALSKRKDGGKLGVVTLKRRLTIARMVFGRQRELKAPQQRLVRERVRERGKLLYTAEEIRKLVKAADPHMKAMVLFGVNCAFGPNDLCKFDGIQGRWHNFPRPKTGVERRCPLWPETLQAWFAIGSEFNGRVWNRHVIAHEFVKICTKAGVRNLGFYRLRRTFETIATTAAVPQAVIDKVMGHAKYDMASVYRQAIFDEQLIECSNHVRRWYTGELQLDA